MHESTISPLRHTGTGADSANKVYWRLPGHIDLLLAAALLALVSFSLPGRDVPDSAISLDLVGLVKVVIRIGVVAWFGVLVCHSIYQQSQLAVQGGENSTLGYLASFKWTSPIMLPWFAYALWSFVTLVWTPLKSVSAGQWLGLVAMLLLAQVVFMRYRMNERTPHVKPGKRGQPSDFWLVTVYQITTVLFLYSLLVFCVHLAAPRYSGLDRDIFLKGSDGFVEPTAAGATASLGLVLAVTLISLRGWRGQVWLIATCMVHVPVLLLSVSRAALATAALCIFVCCAILLGRQTRGLLIAGTGFFMLLSVLADPGFEVTGKALEGTSQYIRRGQTSQQLRAVSGRAEMWEAIWQEFYKSPIVGHGYFVTSESGRFLMWGARANHDAHHVFLQVLVTTGIVGALLFGWALAVALLRLARLLIWSTNGSSERQTGWLLMIMCVWYAAWGQGCTTFAGPVRPESVLFFVLLGLLAGASGNETPTPRMEIKSGPS